MSRATGMTADELLRMPDDGHRYELVSGEVRRMTPAGWKHGIVGGRLYSVLSEYVRKQKLGVVFLAETGFLLTRDPDTVRAPDIAFIHKDHLPTEPPKEAFWPGAPDLAVEVVSPGDTVNELDAKVKSWLASGTAMVWVVNPAWHDVTVYRSASDIRRLAEDDELSGEGVVPGFRCPVREIFAEF